MRKILTTAGLSVAALVLAACTGAPGMGTPAPGEPADPGVPGAPDADQARAALCDPANETGLANIATELEAVDETTDPAVVQTSIGQTIGDLQAVQLDSGEAAVRDAAVTALTELQTALGDPQTRQMAATQAAGAVRAADAELC